MKRHPAVIELWFLRTCSYPNNLVFPYSWVNQFPTWRNNTFESLFLVLMLQHSISKCILVLGHECSSITLMNKSRNIRHSSACLMINKTLVRKIQNLHSNCSMVCKFAFVSLCQSHLVSFLVKFHFSCWFFSYVAIRATSLNWPICHGDRKSVV